MGKFLAIILLAISTGSVFAVDDTEIAKCAVIAGDLDRLQCFDNLAKASGLDRPQLVAVPTTGIGKWNVQKSVNPIDDSTTVSMLLAATSGRGRFGDTVTMVVRCRSNKTEM